MESYQDRVSLIDKAVSLRRWPVETGPGSGYKLAQANRHRNKEEKRYRELERVFAACKSKV